MAKKPNLSALTYRDLVLGADAATLRQALEARERIDELLAERQAAYDRIAALETQVEETLGEPGAYPFPPPPLPVAGLDPKSDVLLRPASGASARTPSPRSPLREQRDPATPAAPSADEADDTSDTSPSSPAA